MARGDLILVGESGSGKMAGYVVGNNLEQASFVRERSSWNDPWRSGKGGKVEVGW